MASFWNWKRDATPHYYAVAVAARDRAAAKGIDLKPMPTAYADEVGNGPEWDREVYMDTPRGHYFRLERDIAFIVMVDVGLPKPDAYADLVLGYVQIGVETLSPDDDVPTDHPGRALEYFIVKYRFDPAMPASWKELEEAA